MRMVTSSCYVHDVDGSHVCLEVLIVSMKMMMMMMDDDDDDDDEKAVQVICTNSPIAIPCKITDVCASIRRGALSRE